MAENSAIEWTHHTHNPWVGCTKVSPGCKHCYAERDMDKRRGFARWGDHGTRVVTSDANWRKPLAWDRKAREAGERHRVFCASLADVFEDREDLIGPRERLFDLISDTPHLDWLLLTKRPENLEAMLPWTSAHAGEYRERYWPHVWLGTSVEDQQRADERIPAMLKIPAAVRFLSMEPLLGPVDLTRLTYRGDRLNPLDTTNDQAAPHIDWIICGGESGPNARPMHPAWARSIRDQCQAAGVPFFFKQVGEWEAVSRPTDADECVRAFNTYPHGRWLDADGSASHRSWDTVRVVRVGKKAAGRMLDGRTWDEFPRSGVAR